MSEEQDGRFSGRYRESLRDSFPIREAGKRQLQDYLGVLKGRSEANRDAFFRPDYANIDDYRSSVEVYREQLRRRIGFPPPGVSEGDTRCEFVAEDEYASIYRVFTEVLEGVETYGLVFLPKEGKGDMPLAICQHGGGGSPEVISGLSDQPDHGSFNYGWMVQRALSEGFAVWAPGLLFSVSAAGDDLDLNRDRLDAEAKALGTSLIAIEVWKISRGLDPVLSEFDLDGERVCMMGLSYGGLYTQLTAALDERIMVAVSSCFFNSRTEYCNRDWCFFNNLNEFCDAEICGLICPRPLMIEVGRQDTLFRVDGARAEAGRARAHWERLGIGERFVYTEFDGGHEFDGENAYRFVNRWL